MIARLVWRNLWRNKRRALITMASVFFAVLLAITARSLQVGVFGNLVKNVVSFHSGYIQVHKRGYWNEQLIDNSFVQSTNIAATIRAQNGVHGVVPRLEAFVLASNGPQTRGCLCVGTNPDDEDALTRLRSHIRAGRYVTSAENAVVIAQGLASKLQLHVGDTLVMLSQGYHGAQAAGKYPIAGIASFASPQLNESLVFLPLSAAQTFFGADSMLTAYALHVDERADLDAIQSSLQRSLGSEYEVMTWKELMPDIDSHMRADGMFYTIMIDILYLLIAFGIFGTTLMMLTERRYELGMLLAIGMKRRIIAWMLFSETVSIAVLGCLAGVAVGLPLMWYFQEYPIRIGGNFGEAYGQFGFEPIMPTAVDLQVFLTQTLTVFAVAVVIGIYPMRKAYTLNAVRTRAR